MSCLLLSLLLLFPLQLFCCGSQNYTDWLQPDTEWYKSHPKTEVPVSCCNATADEEDCTEYDEGVPIKSDNGTLLAFREVRAMGGALGGG